MKFKDALEIIEGADKPKGFMVSFENKLGTVLQSDYFPDKHAGEKLIESEDEAWIYAKKFANKTIGKCVNIYVVDENFSPVKGYANRKIINKL